MTEKPINLRAARADKLGDSREWTPRDALEDVLKRLDAGEIAPEQISIMWLQPGSDENHQQFRWTVAGMESRDHLAMVTLAQHEIAQIWFGEVPE